MRTRRVQIGNATLYQGDCFDVLQQMDVVCDAVITDPPYYQTACGWDVKIDLASLWSLLECKTKRSANYIMFGAGKFVHKLYNSNPAWHRYEMIWIKSRRVGHLNSGLMPMRAHEQILVFGQPGFLKGAVYNPQKLPGGRVGSKTVNHTSNVYDNKGEYTHTSDGLLHPCSALYFKSETGLHPTQKPVALMEYLVNSYSNEGKTVLDCFMGSGSTGVAAINTGRRFIGIERDRGYFDIACKRMAEAQSLR